MEAREIRYETDNERVGTEMTASMFPEPKIGDTFGFGVGGEVLAEYKGNDKWTILGIDEDYTNPDYRPRKPYTST